MASPSTPPASVGTHSAQGGAGPAPTTTTTLSETGEGQHAVGQGGQAPGLSKGQSSVLVAIVGVVRLPKEKTRRELP